MTDYEAQRQALQQQIRDLGKQERREKGKALRAQERAAMSPEQLLQQKSTDILTVKVFGTTEGKEYLSRLAARRPIVHDEIQEALERAANVATQSETDARTIK